MSFVKGNVDRAGAAALPGLFTACRGCGGIIVSNDRVFVRIE
jgi:hypothetical protein